MGEVVSEFSKSDREYLQLDSSGMPILDDDHMTVWSN